MKLKKIVVMLLIFIGVIIIASFFIPKETKPSPDTRIILEHTKHTYIAPPCFEQSEVTNNIADGELEQVDSLDYKPSSACTEKALQTEKDSLFISVLKEIGILNKKSDNW